MSVQTPERSASVVALAPKKGHPNAAMQADDAGHSIISFVAEKAADMGEGGLRAGHEYSRTSSLPSCGLPRRGHASLRQRQFIFGTVPLMRRIARTRFTVTSRNVISPTRGKGNNPPLPNATGPLHSLDSCRWPLYSSHHQCRRARVPFRRASLRRPSPRMLPAPSGALWLHEINWDGFRVAARKIGNQVQFQGRAASRAVRRTCGLRCLWVSKRRLHSHFVP